MAQKSLLLKFTHSSRATGQDGRKLEWKQGLAKLSDVPDTKRAKVHDSCLVFVCVGAVSRSYAAALVSPRRLTFVSRAVVGCGCPDDCCFGSSNRVMANDGCALVSFSSPFPLVPFMCS